MKTLMNRHVAKSEPAQFQVVRQSDGKSTDPTSVARAALHPILQLQQSIGNRAVQRLLANRGTTLQATLTVGATHDPYEQEADRVAQQVMRMPIPPSAGTGQASVQRQTPEKDEAAQTKPLAGTITPLVQRASSDPLPVRSGLLQPKCVCGGTPGADGVCEECRKMGSFEPGADFEPRLDTGGGGSPLPAGTRAFMEPRFGTDFSGVRLHTDAQAADSTEAIQAQAYTSGSHIVFGPGRYAPETPEGKRLLAHELTHVVQQEGRTLPFIQRQPAPAAAAAASVPISSVSAGPSAGTAKPAISDAGPERPSSDFYDFRGVFMTTDPLFMRGELRRLIRHHGIHGGDLWYDALQGRGLDFPLPFSAHAGAFGGQRVRSPLDAQREMQDEPRKNKLAPIAVPLALALYPEVRKEAVDYLVVFRGGMASTLDKVLTESEKRLDTERVSYGLTKKGDGPGTEHEAKNTVAFQGLVGAAKDLLEIRNRISGLARQQQALLVFGGEGRLLFLPAPSQQAEARGTRPPNRHDRRGIRPCAHGRLASPSGARSDPRRRGDGHGFGEPAAPR
jgi:hypothetical protein